jgi:hypothetical protein
MKKSMWAVALAAGLMVAGAQAKLPPPSEEQKAKAAEAAAKAAEANKVAAAQLNASMDRVAQKYAAKLKAEGKPFKPTPIEAK